MIRIVGIERFVDLAGNVVHIRTKMNFDISNLLDQWEYQPGQVLVRKFRSKDGVERIQLRVDLGILQMNAEGRPDGKRPYGHDSLLEHYQGRLEQFRQAHSGNDDGFVLKVEDCSKLQQEAIQYYHRYICLFQLGDFNAVIRDTVRNLKVFDFVDDYAESDEVAWALQQFRAQLLMMQTRARGGLALNQNKFDEAIQIIERGLDQIRTFYRDYERQDLQEQSAEIQSLNMWLEEIQVKRPLSRRERLQQDLAEAVGREDYEKAAKVRDALRNLENSGSG
jgi:tetratricopeptide (TPR) repeat protein